MKHKARPSKKKIVAGACAVTVSITAPLLVQQANAADPEVCVSGELTAKSIDAEAGHVEKDTLVRNAAWELSGKTGSRTTTIVIRSGSTDDHGFFRACAQGPMKDAKLRFSAKATNRSQPWQVSPGNGSPYTFETTLGQVTKSEAVTASASGDVGTALTMIDTLNLLNRQRAIDAPLTVVWPNSQGPQWGDDDKMYLNRNDGRSKHTLLHEAGHYVMDRLNGLPKNTCPLGHGIHSRTDATCAWSEGFATAVASYLLKDPEPVYVFGDPQVRTTNLAPANKTRGQGNDIEANVAYTLIQIWRDDSGRQKTLDVIRDNRGAFDSVQAFLRKKQDPNANKRAEANGIVL
ncbi:hypothetical protein OG735_01115 [Streptomyces sp. NBC_01210]|uniref:hypothetical protein n=1 Tax=Streptomyces sp. NBC_01210 TaxID=2903774 RepID=UPI002E13C91F|nr:hypothetical protein OG735_01115 [Streptomyces sp. NBC_01210]